MKIGPNERCPCGSGKKYKRCCGAKKSQTSIRERGLLILLAAMLVAGLVLVALNLTNQDGPERRKVWSPEHGHYH
jgi:hypothetical protein